MFRIAVFASGSGSNAEALVRHFAENPYGRVKRIFTNNLNAGVIERGKRLNVPVTVFNPKEDNDKILEELKRDADIILLAGYLKLIPLSWADSFEGRMLNIHPALLPKHGGKGMYGSNVHKAVAAAGDTESGITIHFVSPEYDKGTVLAQYAVELEKTDGPEEIEQKVRELELEYYASTVEAYLENLALQG